MAEKTQKAAQTAMMRKNIAGTKNMLQFMRTKLEVASIIAMPNLILLQQHINMMKYIPAKIHNMMPIPSMIL